MARLKRTLSISLVLAIAVVAPAAALGDDGDDCVSTDIEEKPEHSCRHPNPFLGLFMSAPVYFTVVHNQCDEPIEVIVAETQETVSSVHGKARSDAEIVGCGEPVRPQGWCFTSELIKGRCPKDAFRKIDQHRKAAE